MSKTSDFNRIETVLGECYRMTYTEPPVSMDRFLSDTDFLGNVTGGGKTTYPFWKDKLYDISVDDSKYLIVLTGAIGIGKTCSAVKGICYGMHRVLLLKSPWEYFGLSAGGKMAVVFFNLTQSLSKSNSFGLLQAYLQSSPWFKQRGYFVGSSNNPELRFPLFEYRLASPYAKGFATVGEHVLFAVMDEVDSEVESEKQKIRILKAYESTVSRFDSRFVRISNETRKQETLGRFFLCASKQERYSFLNTFIAKMQNSPTVRVIEGALWDVKTGINLSGKKFPIMLGDTYNPPKILGKETEDGFDVDYEAINEVKKTGFNILQVPIEYLERFQKDIVGNLRRLAGVSVDQIRKTKLFPSEKMIVDCYDPAKRNPINVMTIEVGLNDDVDFARYIDFSAIRIPRNCPRYIHVDIAYSGNGDALGLGMSCISGWVDRTAEDLEDGGTMKVEKLPIIETDFGIRIKGRPGDKIPLNKVRKLIVDLKKVYKFNIRLVTFDLDLLSEESKQILTRVGIKCDKLSLDKNPQIYREFRNLVSDRRWCCHRDEYLHFELVNLEDDREKNRIDHPDEVIDVEILQDGNTQDVVLKGSKDVSDGVVGSVENARRFGEIPPGAEFTAAVKNVIPKVKKVNPIGSLLSIDRKRKGGPVEEKENTKSKGSTTSFNDIFKKSQRRK